MPFSFYPQATGYAAQAQQLAMPGAQARPGFIQGISGMLFPTQPGMDPAASQAAQRQALLAMGLGMMGAAQRPGATIGGSLFEGFQGASQTYAGAMDRAFRNTLLQQEAERQKRQEEREEKAAAREERTRSGDVATRLATGISGASDPMGYWNLMRGNPEVQTTLQQFGLQEPQTPEQAAALAQQLGAVGAVSGPVVTPRPVQLKAVVGPQGKPILVPEELAIGQEPAYAPRGKGMSMTLPDGTVIEMGGDGSKVGPGDLSKPTINNLQESIITSTNRLDRLNATLSTYRPEFLQARGIANANVTKVKDFLGMSVSPEQRRYLDEYTQFQSAAATDLAATLKEMSGAAVTPQEYARTEKTLPSGTELSPAEFEAKSKVAVKTISRAIMRANWALKNGIGVQSVEQLAKAMPLEGIDAVYEKRANQIWQELGGTPEAKAEAIRRANQEFGLAR